MDPYDLIAKVIVVGDSTVGKTCLILRYSQDIFKENFLPTIGVDFKTKSITFDDGRKIKLQLWDTAGQERFDSLRKGFYRGAKGVIVVYDITREVSFRNVTKWVNDIISNTNERDCPILGVFGNKTDLSSVRQVSTRAGEELSKSVGATFGEISAKTGEGVNENFDNFVKEVVARIDKQTLSHEVDETSIDVSQDWTRQEESQCCIHKPRSNSSAIDNSF